MPHVCAEFGTRRRHSGRSDTCRERTCGPNMGAVTKTIRPRGQKNEPQRADKGSSRRRKLLAIHTGLFVLVNGFMVGTWTMTKLAPGVPAGDRRAPEGFWPGWLILTWGFVLGLHALYVWVRRVPREAAGPLSSESGRVVATVLFTDIVGSTERAAELGDRRWGELLNRHDRHARELVKRFGGRVVKTLGDGLLAIFEMPRDAILCAKVLRDDLKEDGIDIRAGIHTGEVDLRGQDIGGIGVHIASRIMGAATTAEILTSRTVRDLVSGSEIAFADRGSHMLKGVRGEWQLFSVDRVD
jgi:class 3 adenylate cyclase